MIGIYKITNKINGKTYIGQSNNIKRRIEEHKQKRTQTIDNYINCFGVENFSFEIIEECSQEDLDVLEKKYIEEYKSVEFGYNIQSGGSNNASEEGNGRAILTKKDVCFIREAYKARKSPKEVYEKFFKDKISKGNFQRVWQGRTWINIMPEVYTAESKAYYKSGGIKQKESLLSPKKLLEYRKAYVKKTRKEVYDIYLNECSSAKKLSRYSFYKILCGDVRENSIYKKVPLYKKHQQRWELNREPVSTISESGE